MKLNFWPFKKPEPVVPLVIGCIATTILNDLETIPFDEWEYKIEFGDGKCHCSMSSKKVLYKILFNSLYIFNDVDDVMFIEGGMDGMFKRHERALIRNVIEDILSEQDKKKIYDKTQVANEKMTKLFPHCFPKA